MDQALLGGAQQQDNRQWAENDAQEVSPVYEELLNLCVSDAAPEQIAQRPCRVSLTGVNEWSVHNPVPCDLV